MIGRDVNLAHLYWIIILMFFYAIPIFLIPYSNMYVYMFLQHRISMEPIILEWREGRLKDALECVLSKGGGFSQRFETESVSYYVSCQLPYGSIANIHR